MSSVLWQPIQIGDVELSNRLVMAPMTRSRATASGAVTDLTVEYYTQRASNGLIVTEATQPSDAGQGYMFTPGIYTPEHIAAWRKVTNAVHAAGGRIYIQLLHTGRIGHPANAPDRHQQLAPSAVTPNQKMFTPEGLVDIPEPREMTAADIAQTIADFRHAAKCAIEAGADGIEIHGANGYLVHQFLSDNANLRTDTFGGSVENRIRFALELATAIAGEIGPQRTAIRISPGNPFNDIVETNPTPVYEALVRELGKLNLAYLHVMHAGNEALLQTMRELWPSKFILNRAGADVPSRLADLASGKADAIAFGSLALANPDLAERIKTGAPLNAPDQATFYGGGAKGYTDYPTLSQA